MLNPAGVRAVSATCIIAALAISYLFPFHALAQASGPKVTVFFFSGLCPAGRPDACAASQQAQANISPKLPAGATLYAPPLNNGSFRDAAQLNEALSKIGSDKIVFIAFSAGNQALWQMVQRMNDQQLRQVKSMISLEAIYNGWRASVQKVRSANPSVEVHEFNASQFGTNHDKMPGNGGIGDAISRLATAAQNDTVANLPPEIFQNRQQVQVQYNQNQQQQIQQQLNQLYRPNPAGQFSYLPMPTMTAGLQQAYQPVTTPQQITSYVQNASQPSPLLTSASVDLLPLSTNTGSSTVTFSPVTIGQGAISSMESEDSETYTATITPKDIVSVVVNPQNVTPINATTFTSPDLAGSRPGSLSGFQSNNTVITTLQSIMRGVVNLLQSIVDRQ